MAMAWHLTKHQKRIFFTPPLSQGHFRHSKSSPIMSYKFQTPEPTNLHFKDTAKNNQREREIMRPLLNSSGEVISTWKSPVPYLFGGLGLVLVLMSLALIIIFCSQRKRPSSPSSSSSPQEEDDFRLQVMAMADSEPKILVIMAGHENPTYLANPIVPLSYCTCQPQPPNPSSSSTSVTNNSDPKIYD